MDASDLNPAGGKSYRWQNRAFGPAGYNNCLHINVSSVGVGLSVEWPFRIAHIPLLIAWRALHDRKDASLLWYQVTRFQIGKPLQARLQLPRKVFESEPMDRSLSR